MAPPRKTQNSLTPLASPPQDFHCTVRNIKRKATVVDFSYYETKFRTNAPPTFEDLHDLPTDVDSASVLESHKNLKIQNIYAEDLGEAPFTGRSLDPRGRAGSLKVVPNNGDAVWTPEDTVNHTKINFKIAEMNGLRLWECSEQGHDHAILEIQLSNGTSHGISLFSKKETRRITRKINYFFSSQREILIKTIRDEEDRVRREREMEKALRKNGTEARAKAANTLPDTAPAPTPREEHVQDDTTIHKKAASDGGEEASGDKTSNTSEQGSKTTAPTTSPPPPAATNGPTSQTTTGTSTAASAPPSAPASAPPSAPATAAASTTAAPSAEKRKADSPPAGPAARPQKAPKTSLSSQAPSQGINVAAPVVARRRNRRGDAADSISTFSRPLKRTFEQDKEEWRGAAGAAGAAGE